MQSLDVVGYCAFCLAVLIMEAACALSPAFAQQLQGRADSSRVMLSLEDEQRPGSTQLFCLLPLF